MSEQNGGSHASSTGTTNPSPENKLFHSYLLLFNVGKKANFGQLLRSAMAFGITEVGVVGAKKIADLHLFGNQGTAVHAEFRFFESLDIAVKYFKEQRNAEICGIEISKDSRPIFDVNKLHDNQKAKSPSTSNGSNTSKVLSHSGSEKHKSNNPSPYPFSKSTCFMLGNEGAGMSEKQMEVCDFFTYIPQHSRKTASLNVLVAGSIIFHHFAIWAQFEEAKILDNFKFEEEKAKNKLDRFHNPTEAEKEAIEKKRAERAAKRAKVDNTITGGD